MPACFRAFAVGFSLVMTAASVHADNWDRFRGPAGSGIALDKTIPVKFTPKDALWTTELPGIGHSSPIVWGQQLFLQGNGMGRNRSQQF